MRIANSKTVKSIYWSRYDQDNSYRWIHIKGWGSNGVATRGIWISGKNSHGEFKSRSQTIKLIEELRHPKVMRNIAEMSEEEFMEWVAEERWSNFKKRIQRKREYQ